MVGVDKDEIYFAAERLEVHVRGVQQDLHNFSGFRALLKQPAYWQFPGAGFLRAGKIESGCRAALGEIERVDRGFFRSVEGQLQRGSAFESAQFENGSSAKGLYQTSREVGFEESGSARSRAKIQQGDFLGK